MKPNQYQAMQERHQAEINASPMVFAFGQKQFEEAMKKLGLDPSETDKVCSLYGCGDIIRKTDLPAYLAMIERHRQEINEAIAADKTGDGFIFDMFDYELTNHEYGYTQDPTDTLRELGISWDQLSNDKRLTHGFEKACKQQIEWFDEHN